MAFFICLSAMRATKSNFFAVDDFAVAAFINLASTVGADINAWFNGDGNQFGKAFE